MAISWLKRGVLLLVTALALVAIASFQVQSEDPPAVSFDGLYLEPNKEVAAFYVKPDTDFSVYKRVIMLDAYVAFKKNWQRNTKVAGRRVSNKDMEKIKVEVSSLFHDTFKQQMEADDGYPMVADAGDNVLILRPAIIDLDITAPDIPVAGRSKTYVASAGAATLYL